jgi:hypothetical protein
MEENKGWPGWVKGCLGGCGVFLLLVIMLMAFVCNKVGKIVEDVSRAEDSMEELIEAEGDFKGYAPAGDVSLTADRVERFVRIREELRSNQAVLSQVFQDFPIEDLKQLDEKDRDMEFWQVWNIGKKFAGLLNPVGSYIADRNEILLREQMSIGEYSWIYSVTYYSWLKHDIATVPKLGGEDLGGFGDDDSPLSQSTQRHRYRRVMLQMMANRVKSSDMDSSEWWPELEQELRRMENAPSAIFWELGMPESETLVLEPFRSRLEATWHDDSNVLELPFEESRDGNFQIRVN